MAASLVVVGFIAAILLVFFLVTKVTSGFTGVVVGIVGALVVGAMITPIGVMAFIGALYYDQGQAEIDAKKYHIGKNTQKFVRTPFQINVTLEGPDGKRWSDTSYLDVTIDYANTDNGIGDPRRWSVFAPEPLRLEVGGQVYVSKWVAADIVNACIPLGSYKTYDELYVKMWLLSGPCVQAKPGTFLYREGSDKPGLDPAVRVVNFLLAANGGMSAYHFPTGSKGPG